MAMSCSISLRRSPKPGALTQTVQRAAQLVDTRVARASPSTSSAMISSFLPALHELLQQGQDVLDVGDLLVGEQDIGVVHDGFHLLGVGDQVGREVAAVELHAFDDFESVSAVLDSSMVMTPSLPTFSMASAISLPMASSLLAEMVPTWAMSLALVTAWSSS
jgi:hypothetical protein